ncbi:hypothetical protein MIR68_009681 [Amoeboaphelidium protococcarum]|nr:hypothetical protein MIR68_009681 [Amoeboaphelidium protococcarum]
MSDIVDMNIFSEVLQMDDPDDNSFSQSLVEQFFGQAAETIAIIKDAFAKQDYAQVSRLGHFLKGSASALGITKLKSTCEKIQHCGEQKEGTPFSGMSVDQCALKLQEMIKDLDIQAAEAKIHFKKQLGYKDL